MRENFQFSIWSSILVVFVAVYLYFKYVLYNYWKKKGVFYMEPTVPFGNIIDAVVGKVYLGTFLKDVYLKYKSHRYVGLYTFNKPVLMINDPDLARIVMTKEFEHFHDRGIYYNEKVDPLSGHLFMLPGAKWKYIRSKLTPTFTSGKMKMMFHTIKDCGDQLTDYLDETAKENQYLEFKDIAARYTTDVIMSTAFGIECNSLKNPNNEFRYWGRRIFDMSTIKLAMVVFSPKLMDVFKIPFTTKIIRDFFIGAFTNTVEHRKQNNIKRNDFLQLVSDLIYKGYVEKDDDSSNGPNEIEDLSKLTMIQGAAQAYVFFLAGFETSSALISHCLYELALHPEIQEAVHKDIESALKKHEGLTFDSVNDMAYLHKVVREAMRIYPALAVLNRTCTKSIMLPTTSLYIEKGTDIVIPIYGIHHDPDIYPNPEVFDPERFSEENSIGRHPYAYLPFGEGPRICIGLRFGLLQVKVALISMLAKYKFKTGPRTIPFEANKKSPVLASQDGIHLIIESRS